MGWSSKYTQTPTVTGLFKLYDVGMDEPRIHAAHGPCVFFLLQGDHDEWHQPRLMYYFFSGKPLMHKLKPLKITTEKKQCFWSPSKWVSFNSMTGPCWRICFFRGFSGIWGTNKVEEKAPNVEGKAPNVEGKAPNVIIYMSQGRSTPWSLGMGNLQPLMTGILIMGPYKPLRNRVDEFIPYYMEIIVVDRPDRTYHDGIVGHHVQPKHHCYAFVKCRCRQTTPTWLLAFLFKPFLKIKSSKGLRFSTSKTSIWIHEIIHPHQPNQLFPHPMWPPEPLWVSLTSARMRFLEASYIPPNLVTMGMAVNGTFGQPSKRSSLAKQLDVPLEVSI